MIRSFENSLASVLVFSMKELSVGTSSDNDCYTKQGTLNFTTDAKGKRLHDF